MKGILLILVVAALWMSMHAQVPTPQPPPTLNTCLADAKLWSDDSPRGIVTLDQAGLRDLQARFSELRTCRELYGDGGAASRLFLEGIHVQSFLLMTRYAEFILRHNLLQQMLEEDDRGLR